jgi:hypothetical protein
MRSMTVTLSFVSLCAALLACSGHHTGEGVGLLSLENTVSGTGTIYLNSSTSANPIECSESTACSCATIITDGDRRRILGPTNLSSAFMQQQMRVRFSAQVSEQMACCPPPGLGVACFAIDLVDILGIEPL